MSWEDEGGNHKGTNKYKFIGFSLVCWQLIYMQDNGGQLLTNFLKIK
jgi:hypothetical protein